MPAEDVQVDEVLEEKDASLVVSSEVVVRVVYDVTVVCCCVRVTVMVSADLT